MTVIPATTWLNGNTATAPVLAAYVPGLSLERAQALINERDAGRWFINRGDFVNRLRMPQLDMITVKVGITSEWFRLRGGPVASSAGSISMRCCIAAKTGCRK